MKRSSALIACLLLASTGCTCGQGWSCGRPGFFARLHDRIHGTNVGAPCMSGTCQAPAVAPVAPVMADAGCETCGSGVQSGYESYPSVYDGEVVGSYPAGSYPTSSYPQGSYTTPMQSSVGGTMESVAPMPPR
jgi:hypothetical protein